jgi:hypothetical protein
VGAGTEADAPGEGTGVGDALVDPLQAASARVSESSDTTAAA